MDKDTRNRIQRATQAARELLEHEYAEQLEGVFDVGLDGTIASEPGEHLDAAQRVLRTKLLTAVDHQRASGMTKADAVASYLREAAFTTLNRFVALKMLEARELVQECISRGDQSAGFKEFTGLAPGLVQLPDHGYRVYIESLFDEVGREVRVLFDRRDPASLLWPRRQGLLELLGILNASELASVWGEDETIGWVYQYFNSDDERKAMRAESQAPRNSRELAVRNQFFTPRYVVQFLTDNTLGRIWYEMRQAETRLSDLNYLACWPDEVFLCEAQELPANARMSEENLTQDQLTRRPFHVPFRAKKDPRDICVLDPACGSGHFLLYAFELFLTIYEEAWTDETSPPSIATGRTLRGDYPELHLLHAQVPGLIVRHNLYGIDVDARCTQIAALALWMRAQRALKDQGVSKDARPAVEKTNVVVAEPMPGNPELRDEFLATLESDLARLVRRVFERMELAGDAGSLLRIEDDIRGAVREAVGEAGPLFEASDQARWHEAELEVLRCLRVYADRADQEGSLQRRLFAEDAARGLGFVDVCGGRYDVVLMNPPFGELVPSTQALIDAVANAGRNDIYASFVLRGRHFLKAGGKVGAITSRAFLTGRDHRHFRKEILVATPQTAALSQMADLGGGVLDGAMVETTAFVLSGGPDDCLCIFDVHDAGPESKESALRQALRESRCRLYQRSLFRKLPQQDLLLSLSSTELRDLSDGDPLEPSIADVRQGLSTNDDERFIRLEWEIPSDALHRRWHRIAKGGDYSWFTSETHLVVNRDGAGAEMAAFAEQCDGNIASTRRSSRFYDHAAIYFSRRSQKGFSARRLRKGCCFSDKSGVPQRQLLFCLSDNYNSAK